MSAYYVFDQNEERGPFDSRQITAMWKQGQLTANAVYWAEQTQEWRNISEVATPVATAFKRALEEATKPKVLTPEEQRERDRLGRKIMLWTVVPIVALVLLIVVALLTSDPGSHSGSGPGAQSVENKMGYRDGFSAGQADRRMNSVKMGYGTRQSTAARHSSPLPPQMNRKEYEEGWSAGYSVGYDSYTK